LAKDSITIKVASSPKAIATLEKLAKSGFFDAVKSKIKFEDQAQEIIKEKIRHYEKTGNQRKLAIYKFKLHGNVLLLNKLRKQL